MKSLPSFHRRIDLIFGTLTVVSGAILGIWLYSLNFHPLCKTVEIAPPFWCIFTNLGFPASIIAGIILIIIYRKSKNKEVNQ